MRLRRLRGSRAGRASRRLAVLLSATLVAGTSAVLSAGGASAAAGDVGYSDMSYGAPAGSGWVDPDTSPSASKPQSKLWFAQSTWWGVLNDKASNDYHIFRLDNATQKWVDTGVLVDARNSSHADALWDGQHLFTASAQTSGSSSSNGIQITRYSYAGGTYVPDSGFPVTIASGGVEAASIAKDTGGRIWATFTQSSKLRVAVSTAGGQSWGAAFTPNVSGTTLDPDDISAITSYAGQVTVVWSNQKDDAVYAATHMDSSPTSTWDLSRKVVSGPNSSDDHINLKSVEGDAAGRLYAVVKTGLNDLPNNSNAPLINLLVLGNDDVWRSYVVNRVRDQVTRPLVLIDAANRMLRVFVAGPETGGVVYTKSTPMDNISFPDGKGDPFIKLASDKNVNNPTSTKQSLTAASGLVVLASDQVTGRYVHNTQSLGTPPPPPPAGPVAAFSATPTSGTAPLTVGFSDQSTGGPTSWSWSFGDGSSATTQNPSHTYTAAGTYTVTLTVSNANGTDSLVRTNLVTVGAAPPPPPPGGGYAATVLADNPVGYWRLGGTGSSIAAEAGPGGSAVGGVTSAPGAIGGDSDTARAFDGSTGYVSVPSTAALNTAGDFTIESWVKANTVHSGVAVQKGGASGYSVWQYRLGMTSGGQWRGTVFVGSSAYAVTAPGQAAVGAWVHLVLTRTGSTMSIYVNGTLASTASAPGTLNTTTSILGIGRSGASATSYFDGTLDEVAVYDHALSASAVAAHYTEGNSP